MKLHEFGLHAARNNELSNECARHFSEKFQPLQQQKAALEQRCQHAHFLHPAQHEGDGENSNPSLPLKVNIVLSQARKRIIRCDQDIERASQVKATFAKDHGLLRDPVQPFVILNLLTLGVMVIGESLLNAAFLQNAHLVASPTAALMTSTLISVTNITISTLAGFTLGRALGYGKQSIDPNAKEFMVIRSTASCLFLVFIMVIGFFHLTIGLVRAQESLLHVEHSIAAYKAMLQNPEAVLLVMMGACLSIIAYRKGKSAFSDPYLGYGKVQKAVRLAEDAKENAQEALAASIEAIFDAPTAQSKTLNNKCSKAHRSYNRAALSCADKYRALCGQVT